MTHIKKEQIVVSSILDDPGARIGPAVSMAIANHMYWESVEAGKLAEAIFKCAVKRWRTTPKNVALLLEPDYKDWTSHPTFQDGLPLGLAEVEAMSLLPVYRNKRILLMIAQAYEQALSNPEDIRDIAVRLKAQLEGLV